MRMRRRKDTFKKDSTVSCLFSIKIYRTPRAPGSQVLPWKHVHGGQRLYGVQCQTFCKSRVWCVRLSPVGLGTRRRHRTALSPRFSGLSLTGLPVDAPSLSKPITCRLFPVPGGMWRLTVPERWGQGAVASPGLWRCPRLTHAHSSLRLPVRP